MVGTRPASWRAAIDISTNEASEPPIHAAARSAGGSAWRGDVAEVVESKGLSISDLASRLLLQSDDGAVTLCRRRLAMPEKRTLARAREDKRQGKSASTQAGEFVREEMHHIREGKHGARSTKQAIAIGLSKARRSGVKLRAPRRGQASAETRRSAKAAVRRGRSGRQPSSRRSRAVLDALRREGRAAASSTALGRQARAAAAMKAVRTKGPWVRSTAARKAARTRARSRA